MYRDIISYELAEGVSHDHLLKVAQKVTRDWMKKQPGFMSWKISKAEDGTYCDIVSWTSKEAAKIAEAKMGEIPTATDWFACYKEGTISGKKLVHLGTFR
ncbi:hypothetical protein N8482_00670 [Chitinophagales bacterium]|nr:hypothetical protein [Chitinophagales bacterium]